MLRPSPVLIPLLLSAALFVMPSARAAQVDDGIDITLTIDGDEVHMDIVTVVEARPREVWAVMADFDHMADFISNLKSSRVIARNSPTSFTVEQHGHAGVGPLSFTLDSIRDIQLKPFEWIKSKLLSGGMKKFDGVTRLSEEGSKTRIVYHSDAISSLWIPPVIGRNLIENEAREQFSEIVQEILRRKQLSATR